MLTIDDLEAGGGIGFRHLLEDGLAIVNQNEKITEKRKQIALRALLSLFDSASAGSSSSVASNETFFVPSDLNAARSFFFMEHLLPERQTADLTHELQTAQLVFKQLIENKKVQHNDLSLVAGVLSEVLQSLRFRSNTVVPHEPKEIWNED